jgi:RNA polymerase sigma-70 factor (ECF subfamily)
MIAIDRIHAAPSGPPDAAAEPSDVDASLFDAYGRYRSEMTSFVRRRVHDPDLAEDVVQDVFTALVAVARRGEMPDNPRAWLYRAATNLVVSHARHRVVAQRAIEPAIAGRSVASAEEAVVERETRAAARNALDELSAPARVAVLLAAQGYSGAAIAERLGRTPLATRALLWRSRNRLRRRLEERDLGPPGGRGLGGCAPTLTPAA